jgi:hypothetical protein
VKGVLNLAELYYDCFLTTRGPVTYISFSSKLSLSLTKKKVEPIFCRDGKKAGQGD